MHSIFFLFASLTTFFTDQKAQLDFMEKVTNKFNEAVLQFRADVLAKELDMSLPIPHDYTPLLEEALTKVSELVKAEIALLSIPAQPAEQLYALIIGWLFDDLRKGVQRISSEWTGTVTREAIEAQVPDFFEKNWASLEELQAATPFLHPDNQQVVWDAYQKHNKSPLQKLLEGLQGL